MGMPDRDGGLDQRRLSTAVVCFVCPRPGSPRMESRWRSDKLVVTKGKGWGGRGRLGMWLMYERSGDGCLIDRRPGPREFKKRQGLSGAAGRPRCMAARGVTLVREGTLRGCVSQSGVVTELFDTTPGTRGGVWRTKPDDSTQTLG